MFALVPNREKYKSDNMKKEKQTKSWIYPGKIFNECNCEKCN